MPSPSETDNPYVSRGGLKLHAAIEAFNLSKTIGIQNKTCCDLGCSVGGFVDVWLQHGASKVYAVDTAYGTLAWKLRQDPRVITLERQNALHAELPEKVDLISIDLGWTKQNKAIPAALAHLKDHPDARIITLIKPHYEKPHFDRTEQPEPSPQARSKKHLKNKGKNRAPLSDQEAEQVNQYVLDEVLPTLGVTVLDCIISPIKGAKGGNIEYLALLQPNLT
ncbi:SAM-dependent methyltransferase [Poriferisphaera sp. WC338]|uniref:SAM-dependent methyltransferase n=1 Tax=Poriferisphaera sp. WC338 TaxID=3425129 RepID=UPI003D8189B8